MEFKQFYLGCLAHASYLIGDGGEAAVVDPQRDVAQYLEEAAARGLRIRWVIETHLHADFVSGHRELADRTGAEIVFGHLAGAAFPHRAVRDGDELPVGRLRLRILETPGHTPESICVVVLDASGTPRKVLTGDTLFVGDAGRPDLVAAAGVSPQAMAAQLHASLGRLLELPDDVEVFPAHGAGSLCGRSMSQERSSTIGEQRRSNPALAPMPVEEFVAMMTADLPPQPRYFARDAAMNRRGPLALGDLATPPDASAPEAEALVRAGAVVLDVRDREEHARAHVRGAIAVGLGGQFASWAGTLLPPDRPIVLVVASDAQRDEARMRLARVGIENVAGVLRGDPAAWREGGLDVASVPLVSPAGLAASLAAPAPPPVIDVRRPAEHAAARVPGALNVPLDRLAAGDAPALAALDKRSPVAVICQGGYRSAAAIGLLEAMGFRHLHDVAGGTAAYLAGGHPSERGPATACGAGSSP